MATSKGPASKAQPKRKRNTSKTTAAGAQLDILFSGPLLLVPRVNDGNITGVEVFSPCNGHPIGAVFVPGVLFTDAELDDPECERWPAPSSFSFLDPHSYAIDLTQKPVKKSRPFPVTAIPVTNHKVKPGRRLSADWDVSVIVNGWLSGWTSHRLSKVTQDLFHGADVPMGETTAAMHRFTYAGVTGVEFCGASGEAREYLRANVSKGGTLIVLGEIPYQSTLLHERRAIDALAKLAGLDLHLAETAPSPYKTRLMDHLSNCGHSVVLA
jgi:hypothetical protein